MEIGFSALKIDPCIYTFNGASEADHGTPGVWYNRQLDGRPHYYVDGVLLAEGNKATLAMLNGVVADKPLRDARHGWCGAGARDTSHP